jgi:hypothetical protein
MREESAVTPSAICTNHPPVEWRRQQWVSQDDTEGSTPPPEMVAFGAVKKEEDMVEDLGAREVPGQQLVGETRTLS